MSFLRSDADFPSGRYRAPPTFPTGATTRGRKIQVTPTTEEVCDLAEDIKELLNGEDISVGVSALSLPLSTSNRR